VNRARERATFAFAAVGLTMEETRKTEIGALPVWPTVELGLRATRQMLERGECVTSAMMDWQTEVTRFLTRRIGQSSETMSRMMRCQGMDEVLDIELQWMRAAMDDYLGESKKLFEINNKVFDGFASSATAAAKEATLSPAAEVTAPAPVPAIRSTGRRQQAEQTETSAG
jgi:hypothetical protein